MDHLTTELRYNVFLISLNLAFLAILEENNQDCVEYVEMVFTSPWSNTSLEALDLCGCLTIKGKQMLGIIGDMFLRNHTLMKIGFKYTGLHQDGDAKLVFLHNTLSAL